ncbi:MAG: 6-carboxyhexanoate--CoA ligase [Aquificae bacterium]|nr:6-carboxyhexanoate--CoA ligase [Aquificota bacterium]
MSDLERQVSALREVYREIGKAGSKILPVVVGKFALTVYTQGLYPAPTISLLFPDVNLLKQVLSGLGYSNMGNFWERDGVVFEISNDYHIIPSATFNQVQVEDFTINVVSVEDLLVDMMNQCVAGDQVVCDLIEMVLRSYLPYIDFHQIYKNSKSKQAVAKFKQLKNRLTN